MMKSTKIRVTCAIVLFGAFFSLGCGSSVLYGRQEVTLTLSKSGEEWIFSEPAGLWFTRSEITVSQYRACVNVNGDGCTPPRDKNANKYCNWGYNDRDNHPINCIDWHQASAVCNWLGGRLPTEEEWYAEASNAGTRKYPWGDQQITCDYAVWGDVLNTNGCGLDSTWPVCSKSKGDSVSGLCDMSGNVWEWTATVYDSNNKVLRGGSWLNDLPDSLRSSVRFRYGPTHGFNNYGVRCVRSSH